MCRRYRRDSVQAKSVKPLYEIAFPNCAKYRRTPQVFRLNDSFAVCPSTLHKCALFLCMTILTTRVQAVHLVCFLLSLAYEAAAFLCLLTLFFFVACLLFKMSPPPRLGIFRYTPTLEIWTRSTEETAVTSELFEKTTRSTAENIAHVYVCIPFITTSPSREIS